MTLYIGSDHAGFALKNVLRDHLKNKGYEVTDLGSFEAETKVDYPDIAREVAEKVKSNAGSAGVLVCGTGIGVAIAANKVKGIRAANVHDVTEAKYARLHNDANVVTVGARTMGEETAKEVLDVFVNTTFEGGRHIPRVEKIKAIEDEQ
ncbi:ribose 5-phosphate isomerase B [Candidatus Peregrinibacteria bacterium]|nr:MAG: ribose 5-phosphate isomerase B [Candidatus Peregrinibacteria bacterium]